MEEMLKESEHLVQGSLVETSYEKQLLRIDEEIEHFRKMKLKIYEDLTDGVLDKANYMDLREQYTDMMEERTAVKERIQREYRDAKVHGGTQRLWVSRFREYGNIEKVDESIPEICIERGTVHV